MRSERSKVTSLFVCLFVCLLTTQAAHSTPVLRRNGQLQVTAAVPDHLDANGGGQHDDAQSVVVMLLAGATIDLAAAANSVRTEQSLDD